MCRITENFYLSFIQFELNRIFYIQSWNYVLIYQKYTHSHI